jgi:hypothetical protein
MNIRILAASALALAILVPAANAATTQKNHATVVRGDNSDKCPGGNLNLGTDECKKPGALSRLRHHPAVVSMSSSDMDRGTGGSGTPFWRPREHELVYVTRG